MTSKNCGHVAVLIPRHNEATTIAAVMEDFAHILPNAGIYVLDNNSTDHTIEVACGAGVIVREMSEQGKGSVVGRMFADVETQVYLLADGDDTYDPAKHPN